MSDISISGVESRSDIEKRSDETPQEYLRRVGELADVSSSDVDRIIDYYERKLFAPESTSDENVPIDQFLRQAEDLEMGKQTNENSDNKNIEGDDDSGKGNSISPQDAQAEDDSESQGADSGLTTESRSVLSSRDSRHSRSRLLDLRVPSLLQNRLEGWDKERLSRDRLGWEAFDFWMVAGIAIIGVYVFVQSLGYHPLQRWDEAIYANTARHMVQNGDWIIPHLYLDLQTGSGYLPFLEKPPLVFWLQGFSMALFGVTRFAARLPVALIAVSSGVLVYRFGSRLYTRKAGLVAAIVLFTTPMIFSGGHGGRTASTDVPLLFFGTLFVYVSWIALTEERSDLLPYVGIAAGLTLFTKGFNAGVFVIAVAPLALYHFRTFVSRKTVSMVGLTVGIVLPWSLYAWYRHGHIFISEIFLSQVLGRATGQWGVAQSGTLFPFMRYRYFQNFPLQFDPWVYFLFPAAAVALGQGLRERDLKKPVFLIWWAISTFGFFVLTGNHGWYIMPMFVPCALLIGKMADSVTRRDLVAVFGIGLSIAVTVWQNGITLGSLALTSGVVLLGAFPYLREIASERLTEDDYYIGRRVVPLIAAGLIVSMLVGTVPLGIGGPDYGRQERLGQTANAEVPEGELIGIGPSVPRAWPFSFYAQRPVRQASIGEINQNEKIQYALIRNQTSSEVSREYTVIERYGSSLFIRFG